MKNKSWYVVFILTLVASVCGFSLAFVFSLAEEKIEKNQKAYIERAIYNICKDCRRVEEKKKGKKIVYRLYGAKNFIGYGYLVSGQGYQGKIKVFVVVDKNLEKLLGIEIIESSETPGLGAKINESFFKNQFRNLSLVVPLECVKRKREKDNEIEAITSATISSRAVVNIVNKGIEELKNLLRDN